MDYYPNIGGVNYESIVDGPGIRTTIYLSGCIHNCPECQNADIQNPDAGQECTQELITQIAEEINKRDFLRGITLSGGDPFFDPQKTLRLITDLSMKLNNKLHIGNRNNFDLWIYTGYTWEELKRMAEQIPEANMIMHLACLSVIVDGKFVKDLADKRLKFRGSSNQRLIDVSKSLYKNEPVLWRNKERK